MNLQEFQNQRPELQKAIPPARLHCSTCLQPKLTCYCTRIRAFDPKITFVILIHHLEAKKRLATGRMSHLCLKNSVLLRGYNYTHNTRLNSLLQNPDYYPVVLYPGPASINLGTLSLAARANLFPPGKKLLPIVIDGTWSLAQKTLRDSKNLHALPQICFVPQAPSRFRVRIQPKANYCATIEAIHQTIELVGPVFGFDTTARTHDHLLQIFDHLVDQQIELRKRYS